MSEKRELFKPDRNQVIAVIAMVCAVFAFGAGEFVIGAVLFAVAAVFSLGGLFWNAHSQDLADAEESKKARQETKTSAAIRVTSAADKE